MKTIFKTKLVNDSLFKRNGQEVTVVGTLSKIFYKVVFPDGHSTTVYKTEVVNEEE